MRVSHFLNINTIFWIFTLFCGLGVFIRGGQWIMIKIQKWDFLLAGCRTVGKGEVIKEKVHMWTQISLQLCQWLHTFWKVFTYPRGMYIPISTQWLELCSLIRSFHKYLLSTCNMLDIYISTGDTAVNKISETPCLHVPRPPWTTWEFSLWDLWLMLQPELPKAPRIWARHCSLPENVYPVS